MNIYNSRTLTLSSKKQFSVEFLNRFLILASSSHSPSESWNHLMEDYKHFSEPFFPSKVVEERNQLREEVKQLKDKLLSLTKELLVPSPKLITPAKQVPFEFNFPTPVSTPHFQRIPDSEYSFSKYRPDGTPVQQKSSNSNDVPQGWEEAQTVVVPKESTDRGEFTRRIFTSPGEWEECNDNPTEKKDLKVEKNKPRGRKPHARRELFGSNTNAH